MEARKYLLIGDSISIHYSPYLRNMLHSGSSLLQKDGLDIALENLDVPTGANGGDSSMVLQYLVHSVRRIRCDLALVNCGLHDIKRDGSNGTLQVGPDEYAGNVSAICDLFRDAGIPMAWINTTPVNDSIHRERQNDFVRYNDDVIRCNQQAELVMEKNRIPIIDLNTFTGTLGGAEVYCDHVHFVEWVRRAQAAYIAGWIAGHTSDRLASL